jgi:hypothetical protein
MSTLMNGLCCVSCHNRAVLDTMLMGGITSSSSLLPPTTASMGSGAAAGWAYPGIRNGKRRASVVLFSAMAVQRLVFEMPWLAAFDTVYCPGPAVQPIASMGNPKCAGLALKAEYTGAPVHNTTAPLHCTQDRTFCFLFIVECFVQRAGLSGLEITKRTAANFLG